MDQEKIGLLIKKIRKKHNLTQQQFAEKYGITYQAVSKWENGKNIPDITLIKQISNDFNIDISDLLNGEVSNKDNKIKKVKLNFIFVPIVVLLLLLLIILYISNNSSFKLKALKSNCGEFNISGSIAYNKNKSSIYISDINYCGNKEGETEYKKIECILFEKNSDTKVQIDKFESENSNNIKLDDFLQNISFKVDDYQQSCKDYQHNNLYLQINALDLNGKTILYEIPLSISENCNE